MNTEKLRILIGHTDFEILSRLDLSETKTIVRLKCDVAVLVALADAFELPLACLCRSERGLPTPSPSGRPSSNGRWYVAHGERNCVALCSLSRHDALTHSRFARPSRNARSLAG